MENNPAYALGYLIGYVLTQIVIGAIACFLTAFLFKKAVRWVGKFDVNYWRCYGAGVAAHSTNVIVGSIVGSAVGLAGLPVVPFTAMMVVFSLLFTALMYTLIIKGPTGEKLSYGQSVLAMLIVMGLVIVIIIPLAIISALIFPALKG